MITVALIAFFTFITVFGIPLFIVIGGVTMAGFIINNDYEIYSTIAVMQELYKIAENPMFMAIPLFTFAGYLMAESNTSIRLINLAKAFFGWMPGGLAIVALVTCSFFTVFTGVSGVTIIALGGLLLPALMKEGYPEKFSLGLITIGGSRGMTFPPSLPLILYGVIASMSMQNAGSDVTVSIDNLFVVGFIPGVLELAALAVYAMIVGTRAGVPRTTFNFGEALAALKGAFWELPIPVIIIGGIYGGIFTPGEAAVIVALYVFIIEVFIYKDLHITRDLPKIIRDCMLLVGGIFIIIGAALGLTNFLIDREVPIKLLEWIKNYIDSPLTFLLLLNIFLLAVGSILDIFSAILVVVPLIIPIAMEYGIHPLHLGVIFLLNLEIGYSTPPVGLNLFISSFRFNKPIIALYGAAIPLLAIMFVTLLIITYVPSLTMSLLEDKTLAFLYLGGIFGFLVLFAILMIVFEDKIRKKTSVIETKPE